ncbi:MAG TPA: SGNH/GDSL hydrolase family protein [Phycisphaerae bacterium]|nr:SGNH/GDSL hydrolase family protein [Phycisphaerae bacterium]
MRRCALAMVAVLIAAGPVSARAAADEAWVEPMKQVHARFKGETGTFAHFGDSITISMAFWASLSWDHKNMDAGTQAAYDLANGYMKKACWREWKGPKFGNTGMMTIRWAHENVDTWLKTLNPEAALIMFGTNDLGPLKVDEYEAKTREVVAKCLAGGTVVILSTIPPKHGRDEKCNAFVEAVRRVARDMKVPLCDYYKAIMDRRPDDWSGRLEKFKDAPGGTYEVPTLISRDGTHPSNPKKWQGDYSAEGLKHNGFVLRNHVVLHAYADVIRKVFKP